MKRLLLSLFIVLFAMPVMAQVPQGFNFQAIARDGNGTLLTETQIGVQITVLSDTAGAGTVVYTEEHSVETNTNGLFQIVIGQGSSSDDFTAINWAGSDYFVGLAIDPSGGTSYEALGETRLLSVPYALLAQDVVNGGDDGFTDFIEIDATDPAKQDSLTIVISGTQAEDVTAFGVNAIGFSSGRNRPLQGQIREDAENNASQYAVNGRADGLGGGTHIGVLGSAYNLDHQASNGGTRYGLYGQVASQGRYNFGAFTFANGAGSGEIVPIGDEVDGFNGTYNIGYGTSVTGNENGNNGIDVSIYGDKGSRINIGAEFRVRPTVSGQNSGVQTFVSGSTSLNRGFFGVIGENGSAEAVGMELIVDGSGNNKGIIVNARNGTDNVGIISNAAIAAELNGTVFVDGDLNYTGNLNQTSDRNLKTNITDLDGGLNTIMALRPTSYNFKQNYKGMKLAGGLHYGLIAQEVEEVLPSLVHSNIHTYTEKVSDASGPDAASEKEVEATMEYKSLNYMELVPILIKAMQEQQAEIDALKKRLEELEEK